MHSLRQHQKSLRGILFFDNRYKQIIGHFFLKSTSIKKQSKNLIIKTQEFSANDILDPRQIFGHFCVFFFSFPKKLFDK